jgi:hypothetical protein
MATDNERYRAVRESFSLHQNIEEQSREPLKKYHDGLVFDSKNKAVILEGLKNRLVVRIINSLTSLGLETTVCPGR